MGEYGTSRSKENYWLLPIFWAKHAETLFDHFHQMLTLSISNAAENDIKLYVAAMIR